MEILFTDTALGYALIMGGVILAVMIYTLFKLRKQVRRAKHREEDKKSSTHSKHDRLS